MGVDHFCDVGGGRQGYTWQGTRTIKIVVKAKLFSFQWEDSTLQQKDISLAHTARFSSLRTKILVAEDEDFCR